MANQDNRFYNQPPIPRQQQEELQQPVNSEGRAASVESEAATARSESDESALSMPNPACSSSPTHLNLFDRLVKSFAPSVRAQFLPEGQQTQEADDARQYFSLADLWERMERIWSWSKIEPEEADSSGREVDESSKLCLPVFALDSYKLRGSMLTPNIPEEWQQVNSLSQAADDWLGRLQVKLPDHDFFNHHRS